MDSDRADMSQYTACMHLGIDVREACADKRTGKGQWTYGFVSELLSRDIALTLYTNAKLPADWTAIIAKRPQTTVMQNPTKGLRWHWQTAHHFLDHASIDLYVSTVSYIVPFIVGGRKKVIPVVHDLIAFQHEPHDRRATRIERLTLKRAACTASHICTVSESTKRDLCERYPHLPPASITPIYAGPMSHDASDTVSDGKTILCIATLCPRKNQRRLIEAFASLPDSLRHASRLVLVGKRGWDDEDIVRLAQTTLGVEWRQYLSDEECTALFRTAAVFAFPSLYEGFGMPLLDAFRHGLPVLASNRGSLQEIAGDAALLIDPESIEDIAAGLEQLLTDQALRSRLIAHGKKRVQDFSWKKTVDLFLQSL